MTPPQGKPRAKKKGGKAKPGGASRWLARLAGALALPAAAGGVLAYLANEHWTLDLVAHFRVQYTAVLLLCLAAFLALRRFPLAGLAAAAAVAAGAPLIAYRLVDDVRCPLARPELRVLSLTLPGAGAQGEGVLRAIRGASPDVVFLMDVDARWAEAIGGALGAEYPHQVWEPQDDGYGAGLLSRARPLEAGVVFLATAHPAMAATVREGDATWTVVGTHAPLPTGVGSADRRDLQLEALAARVRGALEPVVVVGTLNTTPWAASFQELLASAGLRDGGEGDWPRGGWGGPLGLLRVQVDHALMTEELCVVERSAGPDVGSRHLPLLVAVARR